MLSCAFMAVSSLKSRRWTKDQRGWHLVCFSAFNVRMCYWWWLFQWWVKRGDFCRTRRLVFLVLFPTIEARLLAILFLIIYSCPSSPRWTVLSVHWGGPGGGGGADTMSLRWRIHIIRQQPNSVVRSAIKQEGLMRRWARNHCPAREPSSGDHERIPGRDLGNTAY